MRDLLSTMLTASRRRSYMKNGKQKQKGDKSIYIQLIIRIFAIVLVAIMLTVAFFVLRSDESVIDSQPTVSDSCSSETDVRPPEEDYIINTVHVTEQPLSEIITDESDRFAANYLDGYNLYNYKPYFDENGGMYYYVDFGGPCRLFYDDGVNKPIDIGLPDDDYFSVADITDGVIYGVEQRIESGSSEKRSEVQRYIERYKDGQIEMLLDTPVEGCYFAEEGIYYQSGNQILLMDYNGQGSRLIVEIPDELYPGSFFSSFIVYRGKLWYSYDNASKEYYYPLWSYDFDKTFTKYELNLGINGFSAVNNGFLYYHYNNSLYRFDCESCHTELVIDSGNDYVVNHFAFSENSILYTSIVGEYCGDLYRLNSEGSKDILSFSKLGKSEEILTVWNIDDRIVVMGCVWGCAHCFAEIDIDGNVIEIIHDDTVIEPA